MERFFTLKSVDSFLSIGLVDVGSIARSVNMAGYPVYTIDYFGDDDVKKISHQSLSISEEYGSKLDHDNTLSEKILKLVKKLAYKNSIDFSLLASGLDDDSLLKNLHELIPLMGNHPDVIKKVRDKINLFRELNKMGMDFPFTQLVNDSQEALKGAKDIGFPLIIKPTVGFGGLGVKKLVDKQSIKEFFKNKSDNQYFIQEHIPGIPASISFLSNGETARILTINEQLLGMKAFGQEEKFTYCGNIVPLSVDSEFKQDCEELASKITYSYGLKGSNGIDIVIPKDTKRLYVMEVNPRFQGTLECVERYLNINLVSEHIKACSESELPKYSEPNESIYFTRVILYSRSNFIAPDLSFYDFVRDVPRSGYSVSKGEPFCSLFFSSNNRRQCLLRAKSLATIIYEKAESGK